MLLMRRFELRAAEYYQQGKIGGFCHLYNGQEAVAAGAAAVCRQEDYWICTYREHGQALAKGMSAKSVMAELFGKVTGCSRGKGGSMHLFSAEHRFYGGHAIVGGHLPLAAGMAHAIKERGEDAVVLCFFGDGAVNNGAFHEALNLAALWKLPVVYLCENNRYAIGTPMERASSIYDISLKGRGYDMECDWFDGMDIMRVMLKVGEAVDRARDESLPTFLEARTYRFRGHSMADPAHYRTKEEVEDQRKRDPIYLLEQRLKDDGEVTEEQIKEIEESVDREVEEAVAFAEGSEEPADEELYTDVVV
ncbi:MAG: pyruvate dehydrogenase (acetyl-transferring) E1 component subunit alpha [Candidatus Tectimicrobiota bacterium]